MRNLIAGNMMKKGFTLAEVLITLAIMGVVAAMTITSVAHQTQKQQFYARFIRAYNMLSNAFNLTIMKNGNFESWPRGQSGGDIGFLNDNIGKHLRIARACNGFEDVEAEECGLSPDIMYYMLNREKDHPDGLQSNYIPLGNELSDTRFNVIYVLQDGMLIGFSYGILNGIMTLEVDTNGPKKGPNTFGRDIFFFEVIKLNGVDRIFPYALYVETTKDGRKAYRQCSLQEIADPKNVYYSCSNKGAYSGYACGARLLLEGKMNY